MGRKHGASARRKQRKQPHRRQSARLAGIARDKGNRSGDGPLRSPTDADYGQTTAQR